MLDHGKRLAVADNKVIEHPHFDQIQRLDEAFGQGAVGLAGLGDARGMVVAENHRCRIVRQGTLDHLARVDTGAVYRAPEQRTGIF